MLPDQYTSARQGATERRAGIATPNTSPRLLRLPI